MVFWDVFLSYNVKDSENVVKIFFEVAKEYKAYGLRPREWSKDLKGGIHNYGMQRTINNEIIKECRYCVFVLSELSDPIKEELNCVLDSYNDGEEIRDILVFYKNNKIIDETQKIIENKLSKPSELRYFPYEGEERFKQRLRQRLKNAFFRWLFDSRGFSYRKKSEFDRFMTLSHAAWENYEYKAVLCNTLRALEELDKKKIQALSVKAAALLQIDCGEETSNVYKARDVYNEIIQEFKEKKDSLLKEYVAQALIYKALILEKLKKGDNLVLDVYNEIVHRFGDAEELSLKIYVAMALRDKSAILVRCGRLNEAIQAYDEVIHQFGQVEELKTYVGDALVNKYYALKREKRWDAIIETCDDIMNRFSNKDRDTRGYVDFALQRKMDALYILKRYDEVIRTYDQFIDKFWACDNIYVKERVLQVLTYKAHDFLKSGNKEAANKVLEEIIGKFGEDPTMEEKIKNVLQIFEQQKELFD